METASARKTYPMSPNSAHTTTLADGGLKSPALDLDASGVRSHLVHHFAVRYIKHLTMPHLIIPTCDDTGPRFAQPYSPPPEMLELRRKDPRLQGNKSPPSDRQEGLDPAILMTAPAASR